MSVCLSVRLEHLGSQWTDFHEISYLSIFRISVDEMQVPLKYNKDNDYITGRPRTFMITCRSVLLRKRNVSDKNCREIQNTHFVFV